LTLPVSRDGPGGSYPLRMKDALIRIGCYTGGAHEGRGIVTARVAADGSRIEQVGVMPAEEASYLAAGPSGAALYAVGETGNGSLAAFCMTPDTLEPLNAVTSSGAEPCHLTVAGRGTFLVAANYASGSVVVRRLRAEGGIGEQTCLVRHTGHGPVAGRQDGPHVHMVAPDPADDTTLLVTDLGADAVFAYRLDPRTGRLTLAARTAMPSGSGPRHLAFHPAEPLVYVLCELDNTLTTCAWDRASGRLTTLARHRTVTWDRPELAACSAILVSPDGRFLYTACRGADSVTVFGLADAAAPERAGVVPSGGAWPRDIALAGDGRLLLCANQESGTVTVFRVDPVTGVPARTGATLTVPAPVCILEG
jgi:6-phosphogluconolactonase